MQASDLDARVAANLFYAAVIFAAAGVLLWKAGAWLFAHVSVVIR